MHKQKTLGSEFSSFCLATAILPAISKRLHSEKVNYSEKEASSRLKINQSEKFLKECIGAFVQLQLNDLLIPGKN
jgi:hypothetical protein